MSGKGDRRRPGDDQAYADNWERIYGNNVVDFQEHKWAKEVNQLLDEYEATGDMTKVERAIALAEQEEERKQ